MATLEDVNAAKERVRAMEQTVINYPAAMGAAARRGDAGLVAELTAAMETAAIDLFALKTTATLIEREYRATEREALKPQMAEASAAVRAQKAEIETAKRRLIELETVAWRLETKDAMHKTALIGLNLEYERLASAETERLMGKTFRALGINPLRPRS